MTKGLATVSAIALSLSLIAPAVAQDATGEIGAQTEVTGATMDRLGGEQIMDRLGEVGIEDRDDFEGMLVRAQSPEGHPVIFLFGPRDLTATDPVDIDQDEIRGRLTQAGFSSVEFVEEADIVHGRFADDKHVLAMSGDHGWRGAPGVAQAGAPDMARFEEHLGALNFEDRTELNGRLMHTRTATGQTLFVLVGPEGFEGDASVDMTAEDLNRFQQSGFQGSQMVEDVRMFRATMGDMAVIALSGQGITDDPAPTTGAIGTDPIEQPVQPQPVQ
jgi:hypothetical protein